MRHVTGAAVAAHRSFSGARRLTALCLCVSFCSSAHRFQKRTRFENEKYLRSHPELGVLIQDFIGHVLEKRPDDIEAAAVDFFVREGDRRSKLQQQTTAQQ